MNLINILPELPFQGKVLKDTTLKLYDDVKFTDNIKEEVSVVDSKLILNIEPTASINTYVINEPDDIENEELSDFYLTSSELAKELQNRVVVMHAINGRLNSSAGLPIKDILSFDLGLNKSIWFKWYKPYDKNLTVGEALTDELQNFKTLVTDSDEQNFWDRREINEAFSYTFNGELDFNVTVNLVEVLSMAFAPVFSLTSAGQKIPFEIDPSLKVGFKVAKNDVFECLIHKIKKNECRLKLLKKKVSTTGVALSGGLSLSLFKADQDKIKKVIDEYFENYLGAAVSEIDKAIEKYDAFVDDEFLGELIDKIDFVGDNIDKLKEHYEGYKEKITKSKESVLKLVSETVQLGLTYEYKKVIEKGVFMDANLSINMLNKHIKEIIKLDVRNILDAAREGKKGITVNEFFTEELRTFERHFSIGISFGNWSLKTSNEDVYSIDKKYYDLEDKRTVTISYLHKKEKVRGKEKLAYQVSMNCESNVPDDDITYEELEYALTLTTAKFDDKVKGKKGRRDMKDLNLLLTTAVAWGGIDTEQIQSYSKDIWNKVYGDENVGYECKLSIPINAFEDTLNAVSQHVSIETIANAMAVAILPDKKIRESTSVEARLRFYPRVIRNRFKGIGTEVTLQEDYYMENFKKWALHEIDRATYTVDKNSPYIGGEDVEKARDIVLELVDSIKDLNDNIKTGAQLENHQNRKSKTVLNRFFKLLKRISKDDRGFSQRWFGQLIIAALEHHQPELLNELVRTLTITYQDKSKEKVMVIGN